MVEQVLTLLAAPALLLVIDRAGRHHQMHMRMEIEPPVMGMQDRHRSGCALQGFVILTESINRFPCTFGDQVVEDFLMLPHQRSPLRRQGERDHKIIAGELFGLLAFYPLLRFVRLTMRAVAVPAGVRDILRIEAVATRDCHARTEFIATGFECRQCAALAG